MQELTFEQVEVVSGGSDDASSGGAVGFAWAGFRAVTSPVSALFYSSKLGNGEMPQVPFYDGGQCMIE